jgi:OmpA-OmpF porin, OOP family
MSDRVEKVSRVGAPALRGIAVRAFVVTALTAAMSGLQAQAADDRAGYLTTGDGRPVADAFGDCVHTGEWVPGMHYRRCDAPPVKAAHVNVQAEKSPMPVERARIRPTPVPFKVAIDTLFDFDRATLKPQGRALLDRFADRIGRAEFQAIDIVGHADRIGSASYNQRLSERRARAVRDYLAARGLDARKLSSEGAGSSEPVTAAGQCSGLRGSRLIQCLQPDRYAELKVSGTAPNAAVSRAILELESAQAAA